MRQGLLNIKRLAVWACALFVISSALQSQTIPPPPISVAYDKKAWDELLQTELGRTVYFEVRTQVMATIVEQLRKAELNDEGMPTQIKNDVELRPLEKWFDQFVDPTDGLPVLDANAKPATDNKALLPNGFRPISRQEYYLQQIEKSLMATSGVTRGRPAWLDQSMNNWRQIFGDLRAMSVLVSYSLDVYPKFKTANVLVSDPKHLNTAVDGPNDIARARALVLLDTDVMVNSIGGSVTVAGLTYDLPLFPNYNQKWLFTDITGTVDLAATLDVNAEVPFFANFGPLATNLGEVKDEEGDVIWDGIHVPKSDVDYFLNQLLQIERYEKILQVFYSPKEWNEDEGMAGPFKELPLARKILVQSVRDAENVLSEKTIPLVLYLFRSGDSDIEVGYAMKTDPALAKTIADFKKEGRLIGLFEGDITLTARPSVDVDLEKRQMILGLDLPEGTDVTFQVKEFNFPQFLFKDAKNEIVRKILDSLPKGNLVGPDAKVKISLTNSGLDPNFFGPPTQDPSNDIRMTIPYTYMTPSEWRLKQLDRIIKNEENRPTGQAIMMDPDGVPALERFKQERASLQSDILNKTKTEYPVFVVDDDHIVTDFSGLKTAYISKIEAHLSPGIQPLVLEPRSDRTLAQQAYDQIPSLIQNARAILPVKTMKTIETAVQDRLQELVSGINKTVVKPDLSFGVSITDFKLPDNSAKIKWDGVRDPAKDLVAVDPNMLSTAYEYLFNLPAKHELTTTLKLPKSVGVRLTDVKTEKADIPWLQITAGRDDEPEVTIQWKIVEDAAGELHTIPYLWNFPAVFNSYKLTELDYGGASPKGVFKSAAKSVAGFSGGVGALGGIANEYGVEIGEAGVAELGWVGRRLNNIGVGWLIGKGTQALGWGYETVGGGIASGYQGIESSTVREEVEKAFEEAKPGIIDVVLEQGVKGVSGELKPDLPMDAEQKKKLMDAYVNTRMIFGDGPLQVEYINPVTSYEERDEKARKQRTQEWAKKLNPKDGDATSKEEARKFLVARYEQEWLSMNSFVPVSPEPRDKDAPMPALQRTFEDAFATVQEVAPVRKPLGEWKIKEEPLLGMLEDRARTIVQESVNGERPEFWPDELTNARMIKAAVSEVIPAIRRQVSNLPKDNQDVVETVIRPDKLFGNQTNAAVNALIEKALRGEMTATTADKTPPPIPEPPPNFVLDLPELVCRGLPLDPDGATNDDLVLLHLYQEADRKNLPVGLVKENPQAEVQKRVSAILYWDPATWDPNTTVSRDLSEAGQLLRNKLFQNDPDHRTPKGAAIFELNSLLETLVQPNIDGIIRDLEAKIIKDQGLANDSLHIGVTNLNIQVGPKPETGEQGFVVDFDLEVTQDGIGKDGVINALSTLLGREINTTGYKPWFSSDGNPKPLHITWPLNVSLSNRANARPDFTGQEMKPGYDAYLASEFPIKVEGPNASRSIESWILIKGPLLDALKEFKTTLPIDRSIGIPSLEKYTQVELRTPVMLPSEKGKGYAVIPFSINLTDEGKALPKQFDEEAFVRPMRRLVPYLLKQPPNTLFHNAAQSIRSKLSAQYQGVDLQFLPPSEDQPALRENKDGELEYHVGFSATHSEFSIPAGRYEVVYKVKSFLEHDLDQAKGANLIGDLSAPRIIAKVPPGVLAHTNNLITKDFLHHLERTDSPKFVWDHLSSDRVPELSYR